MLLQTMDWKRISRKRFVLFIFTNTLIDFNLSFSQIKFTFALTQLLFCLKVLFLLPMIDFLTFPNRYISWNINIFTPSVHSINFVTPCMACLLRDLPVLSVIFLRVFMIFTKQFHCNTLLPRKNLCLPSNYQKNKN